MARTFVGTPSYLAPEVEEKQGGRGKPYGTPVDCWSLGAMLYVMLVARFPEFQLQVWSGNPVERKASTTNMLLARIEIGVG